MSSFKIVEDTTPGYDDSTTDGFVVFEVNAGGHKSFWKVPTTYDSQSGIDYQFGKASHVKQQRVEKVVWETSE